MAVTSKDKRIAKNTIYLYSRQLLLLLISLYTSRVVLDKLGVVDFGIYNVIAGFILILSFFSSSLSNATQRFLNIELGKDNIGKAREVFNLHLFLYILIVCAVILIAETAGLYFIENKLNIPAARLQAAGTVYHCAVVQLAITLIGIVYNAVIIAHENMRFYSYTGVAEGVAKLVIAYMIGMGDYDRLAFYAFLLMTVTLAVQASCALYSYTHYEECKPLFYCNLNAVKRTGAFISWNFLATFIYIIKDQGTNMLLNIFFGPMVNAARAVAYQVNGGISNFSSNFFTAVRPQIVKSYAAGDIDYLKKLFFKSSKFSLYLTWFLCLPAMLCINSLLSLWLKEVPQYANIFTLWLLAESIPTVLTNPTWSIVMSTGRMRNYVIWGFGALLLIFPAACIALWQGASPVSVFSIAFTARILQTTISVFIANKEVNFGIRNYLSRVIRPFAIVALFSVTVSFPVSMLLSESFMKIIITVTVTSAASAFAMWTWGLTEGEKGKTRNIITNKIKNGFHIR